MDIKTKELEIILKKISEHLSSYENSIIKIEEDNYLLIGSDSWYNVFGEEAKPVVGSLKDDWESLCKNVFEEDIVTSVDLDRLSAILRAISQHQNPI